MRNLTAMERSMKNAVSGLNELMEHLQEAVKDDIADGDIHSAIEDSLLYQRLLDTRTAIENDSVFAEILA